MTEMVEIFVKVMVPKQKAEEIAANNLSMQAALRDTSTGRISDFLAAAPAQGNMAEMVSVQVPMERREAAEIGANAMMAAMADSLLSIGQTLVAMENRLEVIEQGIAKLGRAAVLTLRAIRKQPVHMLRAAQHSALAAFRERATDRLASAAKDAEYAARELLGFAEDLALGAGDIPRPMSAPIECAELVEHASIAMQTASFIYSGLGHPDIAASLMRELQVKIEHMRAALRDALVSPDFLHLRLDQDFASDQDIIIFGQKLGATARSAVTQAQYLALGASYDAAGMLAICGGDPSPLYYRHPGDTAAPGPRHRAADAL